MKLGLIVFMILFLVAVRQEPNLAFLFSIHLITSLKTHRIYGESSVPPPMSCACIKIEILLYSNAQYRVKVSHHPGNLA